MALERFQTWFGGLSAFDAAAAVLLSAALLFLLTAGNGVPSAHPYMRDLLRSPTANSGAVLGMFAPGQVVYAAVGLAGLLLPRSVDRLLVR